MLHGVTGSSFNLVPDAGVRMLRFALVSGLLFCAASSVGSQTVHLRGGRYLDLRVGISKPNGTIVVRDGRIAAMLAPGQSAEAMEGVEVIDLGERTLLPGLIDAHVHLTLAGDPRANAEATLRAGFTTVIDLGSANGGGVALRDAIASGQAIGPRMIAAGSWIGVKGGVCEFGGATVSSPEEAGTRARADLTDGADLLKVCVTGWPREAVVAKDSVQLKAPFLAAVMSEGRTSGRPVFAHAIGQAGALLAATNGIRVLAHTPIVDSAAAVELAASGVRVISTLATLTAGAHRDDLLRSFRLLRSAGVPIVMGTDAGVMPHGNNARELVSLQEAGLSPIEALRSATLDAAALIGEANIGVITVGATADLIAVDGDPLSDLRVLQRPVLVVRGGRVVVRP
jgi:imidazolonepropionase-like amidohydrolase